MQGTRVLVTGGAGFIGSHLVEHLGARNEIAVLDDLSAGSLRNLETVPRDVHVKRASILNRKALSAAMEGREIVYHLAAKTSVPDSVAHPEAYWRTHGHGPLGGATARGDAKVRRGGCGLRAPGGRGPGGDPQKGTERAGAARSR